MHGNQIRTVGLALLSDFDTGQVVGIPADAHFHGQRGILAQGTARSGDHLPTERRVQQQLTACTAVGNFGRRAAHVDIQNVKPDALFAHEQDGFFQRFRLAAKQLDGVQPVGVCVFEQGKGFLVVEVQGLGAGHLTDGPGRAVVGHQMAAGGVGKARHGGKHRPGGDLQIA